MPVDRSYYYLNVEEIQHYAYMLHNGYSHKTIDLKTQKFIVFALLDKPHVGIAWPTVTGNIDGASFTADTIFEENRRLQGKIMPRLAGSTIRCLLFPRYAD